MSKWNDDEYLEAREESIEYKEKTADEMCKYCNIPYYIKTKKYMKSLIAPATEVGMLINELEDITGEMYLQFKPLYCPMCGRRL